MAFNLGQSLISGAKKPLGAVSPIVSGLMAAVKIAKTVPKVAGAIPTPSMAQTQQAGMIPMTDKTANTKQQLTPAPTDAQLNAARAKAQPVQPAQLAAVSAVRQGTANAPTAPAAPVAPQAPEAPVASTPRQDTGAGRVTLIGPDGKKVTAPAGSAVMQGYIRQGYTQEGTQAPTAPVAPQVTSGAIVEPPAGTGTLTPEQQRDALRQSLLESMRIGKDEAGTQAELDALNADANAAIYDVEATGSRRGFTTGYATGLQGAIGRQAEIAKLPLEARIANLQAQRNADRAATQAQLGFVESDINQRQQMSQKDAEAKRAILLQALQGGATQEQMSQILGAKTPDEAIQIAGNLLTPKQKQDFITLSAGETVFDPATGQPIYQAPVADKGFESLNPLQQLQYQQQLAQMSGTSPEQQQANQAKIIQSQEVIGAIDGLLTDPGLNAAVGPFSSMLNVFGDAKTFQAKLEAFRAKMVLPELGSLKGALSDKDIQFLKESAGALNPSMNQAAFKQTLNEMKARQQHVVNKLQLDPQLQSTYDQVRISDPSLSPEDVLAGMGALIQQGTFNNAQTTALNGSIQLGSRLAQLNNNPGNLRFAGQPGATQGEGGFARFPTPQAGVQALQRQIQLDASRGLTLAQFINKYAPPVENDTGLYLQQMAQATGATPNTPVRNIDLNALTRAMAMKESSTRIA